MVSVFMPAYNVCLFVGLMVLSAAAFRYTGRVQVSVFSLSLAFYVFG